ncbi:MAG: hypothetical protein RLZZ70_74 [Candidatus Parcubacteria bacterium]|jgi:uncharacterized membrane protein
MNIMQFLTLYVISVPIFFAIDMVWLGLVASNFYREKLGYIMGDINWPAAITFYLVFLVGLVLFAIYPAVAKGTVWYAVLWGGLFGFFTYATYDLTNLATLRDWPLSITIVDMLWGTFLGASVAGVTYVVYGLVS